MAGMMPSEVRRLIDANLNRSAEGLRLLEDIARFLLDDSTMTESIRDTRHLLLGRDLELDKKLIEARDTAGDVGSEIVENERRDLAQLIVANAHRVQESLRVLEELAKEESGLDSAVFKKARFFVYGLEKELLSKVLRKDKKEALRGLYLLFKGTGCLPEEILFGAVTALELDGEGLSPVEFLALAKKLTAICRRRSTLLIIKSRLDVALACRADGLVIGVQDLPVDEIRALMPLDMLLGVMVDDLSFLDQFKSRGADFAVLGFRSDAVDKVATTGRYADFPIVIRGAPMDSARSLLFLDMAVAIPQEELSWDLVDYLRGRDCAE